jgi:glycosyltransferase involved in cell wall biosynthesis
MRSRAYPVTNDLVSVVIPAHNAMKTIAETLSSVSNQTYPYLEILVVDDGSTDATAEVVQAHARRDPRVRLIRQQCGGVAAARNRGIAEAKGEYIAPIDADDLWQPSKIAKQMQRMREGGERVGLVYTWYAGIDAQSCITSTTSQPNEEGNVVAGMCRGNIVGNGSAALMRKGAVDEAGRYDPNLRACGAQGCEDLQLYFRIAERYEFALVREHLTGYRCVPGNMSSDILQMLRSNEIVIARFRDRYPQHAREFYEGQNHYLRWLLLRGLQEWSLTAALVVYGKQIKHDPLVAAWMLVILPVTLAGRTLVPRMKRLIKVLLMREHKSKLFLSPALHQPPTPDDSPEGAHQLATGTE